MIDVDMTGQRRHRSRLTSKCCSRIESAESTDRLSHEYGPETTT